LSRTLMAASATTIFIGALMLGGGTTTHQCIEHQPGSRNNALFTDGFGQKTYGYSADCDMGNQDHAQGGAFG
jgi:hypothetical protein